MTPSVGSLARHRQMACSVSSRQTTVPPAAHAHANHQHLRPWRTPHLEDLQRAVERPRCLSGHRNCLPWRSKPLLQRSSCLPWRSGSLLRPPKRLLWRQIGACRRQEHRSGREHRVQRRPKHPPRHQPPAVHGFLLRLLPLRFLRLLPRLLCRPHPRPLSRPHLQCFASERTPRRARAAAPRRRAPATRKATCDDGEPARRQRPGGRVLLRPLGGLPTRQARQQPDSTPDRRAAPRRRAPRTAEPPARPARRPEELVGPGRDAR